MNDLSTLITRLITLAAAGRITYTGGAPEAHVTIAFQSPERAQEFHRTLREVVESRGDLAALKLVRSPREWEEVKQRFDEKRRQCQALAAAGDFAARHSLRSAFASLERRYAEGERTPALYRMMRIV